MEVFVITSSWKPAINSFVLNTQTRHLLPLPLWKTICICHELKVGAKRHWKTIVTNSFFTKQGKSLVLQLLMHWIIHVFCFLIGQVVPDFFRRLKLTRITSPWSSPKNLCSKMSFTNALLVQLILKQARNVKTLFGVYFFPCLRSCFDRPFSITKKKYGVFWLCFFPVYPLLFNKDLKVILPLAWLSPQGSSALVRGRHPVNR